MKKKIVLAVFIVVFVVITFFLFYENNKLKKENNKLEENIESVKSDNNKEELNETDNENTFKDDVEWLVTEIYASDNRYELYNNISESIDENVEEYLFGENVPPEKEEPSSKTLERKIENTNVFGKYKDDEHYQAVVVFDVAYKYHGETDTGLGVVQVDMKKTENDWLVTNFVEYTTGFKGE